MTHRILVDIIAGRRRCDWLEERLRNPPRWRPKLKSLVAEVVAECIAELLGSDVVEEIYYIDLSGGEVTMDFSGRDIDLIVKLNEKFMGLEGDVKRILEEHLNARLKDILAWYVSETGKRDLIELHVVTKYTMGYATLIQSRFNPAIRVWPKRRSLQLQGQVFPF